MSEGLYTGEWSHQIEILQETSGGWVEFGLGHNASGREMA